MEPVTDLITTYLVILLLAFVVERIMEVLMAFWGYLEWKREMHRFWNKRAERLMAYFQDKAINQLVARTATIAGIGKRVRDYTSNEEGVHSGNIIIFSGEAVRNIFVSSVTRIVASAIGILFCVTANINVFEIVLSQYDLGGVLENLTMWPGVQLALSGIIIGLGSEPVHHLIKNLERKREARAKRARLEKAALEAQEKL